MKLVGMFSGARPPYPQIVVEYCIEDNEKVYIQERILGRLELVKLPAGTFVHFSFPESKYIKDFNSAPYTEFQLLVGSRYL